MAQSRGTRLLSSLLVLCLITLSGCSADFLRPDLFKDADMRAFPKWAEEGEEGDGGDSSVRPGAEVAVWPNGSPSNKEYSYKPQNSVDDSSIFAPMASATIQSPDYCQYLQTMVYSELYDLIQELTPEDRKDIYLRVGHTGYYVDSNGLTRRASGWQDAFVGDQIRTDKVVGGDALMYLADDWLGGLDVNNNHVDLQVSKAQQEITNNVSADAMSKDWYAMQDAGLPQIYRNLMGRDGADFSTLQEYYDAIASDPYHNIPNFSLQMRTGETTTDTVTFNKTSPSIAVKYQPGVSLDTVDKMFRVQNQYSTREREALDTSHEDDSSLVRYYLDGYNKTVIYLGCTEGKNLSDILGAQRYEKMRTIIDTAYNCTQVSEITSIVPTQEFDLDTNSYITVGMDCSGFVAITAGSKGDD